MTQGERVKSLRKSLNLTLDKFGERLGVTKVAISNIERGNRNLTDQMSKAICNEFDVNEKWLQTGEGEMFVELTRDEQIADFIGKTLRDVDDTFQKRFIAMLASLDVSDWETLKKMADFMTKEKE